MMQAYFDNSATTRPYDKVCDTVYKYMRDFYENPSSLHSGGKKCEDEIILARKSIASFMGILSDELYFTSGGTESNNLAIMGFATANARSGNKIITQPTEHPSVLECYLELEKRGFNVEYVKLNSSGVVDLENLYGIIDDNTILVSIMHVNNETGAIMPIKEISKIVKEKNKNCTFFSDGVQGFGKIKLNLANTDIDMYSVSAHKLHGPKGVGAVYIKKGTKISPTVYGGSHEKGIRSGTLNTPGICGFNTGCKIKFKNLKKDFEHVKDLKKQFLKLICDIPEVYVNSFEESLPYILNISILGVKSEVLLHVLESKGVFVSSASACSSNKKSKSHVLTAMGFKPNRIDSALRFSFSSDNKMEEVEYAADILKKEVPILRKVMGFK